MPATALRILGLDGDADWPAIRSAYRAMARRFHPDGSAPDPVRMAEINRAYEVLERRHASDGASPRVPVGPGRVRPPAGSLLERIQAKEGRSVMADGPARPRAGSLLQRVEAATSAGSPVIDFGEYAGWRIADVARIDRRYLHWLSRHSSGIRFRAAIAEVLGDDPELGRRAALVR